MFVYLFVITNTAGLGAVLKGKSLAIQSEVKVTHLSCEYRSQALGIDKLHPRLSWQLVTGERGQRQSGYQVLVAYSYHELSLNKGIIWNSGIINSSQSIQLEYRGPALRSRKRYFWKVRIWDKNKRLSEWSAISWWEMGLLSAKDWTAKWISAPTLFDFFKEDKFRANTDYNEEPKVNEPAPIFRKELQASKAIRSARAYVVGLGYYELFINGKKVEHHVLDPAFTDYSKTVLYTTYDIGDLLNTGKNAIGVNLANGWFHMTSRALWSFDKARWNEYPALLCQIEITYADGTTSCISSDQSWACSAGPLVFNSIQQGESYDARLEQPGWKNPGFDASKWVKSELVRGPQGKLIAASIPPVQVMQTLKPVSIKEIRDSVYVVDFGQNISGFEQITATGKRGTTISMKCGEKLYNNGLVDQDNIKFQVRNSRFQTDEYTLSGEGPETWHPSFNYNGFRFVEVSGYPGKLKPENIKALVTYTSFESAGTFDCSNKLINQINEAVRWSYTNNFVGYPTDCPHREKNGWTGDAQLAAETGLYNYKSQSAYKKWIHDMADAQKENGLFPSIVPTAGWGYSWGNGPAWDHAFIAIPWFLYVYNNDQDILSETYPYLKKYIRLLNSKADGNIINWGLGDWAPALTKTPEDITSTAYYYQDVLIASKIALLLGEKQDARYYQEMASHIKISFNQKFYHASTHTYANNSQTALACPLYMEMVDKGNKEDVLKALVKAIKVSDLNLDFGILGSKFVPNVLADNNRAEIAYNMINSTAYPGWGNIINRGGTTLWSTWDGKSSLNHVMFGDVSAWFYKHLAGIQPDPDNPGFKHFYLRPFIPEDMQWVKASYQTMYGTIEVEWKKKSGNVSYEVSVPTNTSVSVELPVKDINQVKINDKNIKDFKEAKIGRYEKNSIHLPSGTYIIDFQAKN